MKSTVIIRSSSRGRIKDNTYKITNYETHLLSLTMNMSDNEKVRKEDKFLEDKKEEVDEVKVILSK